jgi:hypothetical protein
MDCSWVKQKAAAVKGKGNTAATVKDASLKPSPPPTRSSSAATRVASGKQRPTTAASAPTTTSATAAGSASKRAAVRGGRQTAVAVEEAVIAVKQPRKYTSAAEFMIAHFPEGVAAAATAAATATATASERRTSYSNSNSSSSGAVDAVASQSMLSPLAAEQEAEVAAVKRALTAKSSSHSSSNAADNSSSGMAKSISVTLLRRALVVPQDKPIERCLSSSGRCWDGLGDEPLGGWTPAMLAIAAARELDKASAARTKGRRRKAKRAAPARGVSSSPTRQ